MKQWAADGVKVQTCVTSPPYYGLRSYLPETSQDKQDEIGLEETPEEFINNLVDVFRHVRDILADDGTIWVNIGDSYASFRDGKATPDTTRGDSTGTLVPKGSARNRMASTFADSDVKHKDLIGIPWMLAFALRADGWYLRQDIIWHKPNPMPESVRDRCTKTHEYIFLLSKSEKYFFDHEAIKEPSVSNIKEGSYDHRGSEAYAVNGGHHDRSDDSAAQLFSRKNDGTRNKRSVWTVNTKPYKGAHFAVYPEELITPCILAGSRFDDIVFDPFMGSGTTAAVAIKNGRQYLGCELNPDYGPLQQQRIDEATKTKPPIIDGDADSLFTFEK
jgi:DNA modification methylase